MDEKNQEKSLFDSPVMEQEHGLCVSVDIDESHEPCQVKAVYTKDSFFEILKEKVTDFINRNQFELETDSDDTLLESIIRIWDIVITENEKMKQEFRAATDVLQKDPRLAVLFNEVIRGTPIRVALVRSGIYDFTPQPQDSDYPEYEEALRNHKQRREEYEMRIIAHRENCKHTAQEIDEFYNQKGITDDVIEDFSNYVINIFNGFTDGIIDCNLLEALWKGYVYDKSILEAKEVGKIEGRNEIIEKRNLAMNDDGISRRTNHSNSHKAVKEGYIERIMNGSFR